MGCRVVVTVRVDPGSDASLTDQGLQLPFVNSSFEETFSLFWRYSDLQVRVYVGPSFRIPFYSSEQFQDESLFDYDQICERHPAIYAPFK